jgi:hypothetical protein
MRRRQGASGSEARTQRDRSTQQHTKRKLDPQSQTMIHHFKDKEDRKCLPFPKTIRCPGAGPDALGLPRRLTLHQQPAGNEGDQQTKHELTSLQRAPCQLRTGAFQEHRTDA